MDQLLVAFGYFKCEDKDLKLLMDKIIPRLIDDLDEAGYIPSSVMEDLLESLEEHISENYTIDDDEEDEDEDEDDLRDVDEDDD